MQIKICPYSAVFSLSHSSRHHLCPTKIQF
ncbi:hypothetical protein NC651_021064 [Populus alba x Populus x berolinensis]|nr:hypothetical protein NC651_021064 [Populus alba x Populus x berolinensis]